MRRLLAIARISAVVVPLRRNLTAAAGDQRNSLTYAYFHPVRKTARTGSQAATPIRSQVQEGKRRRTRRLRPHSQPLSRQSAQCEGRTVRRVS